MTGLIGPSSRSIDRLVSSVYGRERIAETVRAVVEDVIYPASRGSSTQGASTVTESLRLAIDDIAATETDRLVERLTRLLEATPITPRAYDLVAFDLG